MAASMTSLGSSDIDYLTLNAEQADVVVTALVHWHSSTLDDANLCIDPGQAKKGGPHHPCQSSAPTRLPAIRIPCRPGDG
jgi:hypothetical protein